ncbi:hypothetical protein F5B20DRAFT_541004 [Whalleya microplaca]|nr:hypothetical protein F5B20DRAFT_541004 [Whalleya microplaca]
MFSCERTFYIVLDDGVDIGAVRASLPGLIAMCPARYLHNRKLHRPVWADRPAAPQIETLRNSGGNVPELARLLTSEDSLSWYLKSPYTGDMVASMVVKSTNLGSRRRRRHISPRIGHFTLCTVGPTWARRKATRIRHARLTALTDQSSRTMAVLPWAFIITILARGRGRDFWLR